MRMGPVKDYYIQGFLNCFIEHYSLYIPAKRCFSKEVKEKSNILFWLIFSNFDMPFCYAEREMWNGDCVSFLICIFVF